MRIELLAALLMTGLVPTAGHAAIDVGVSPDTTVDLGGDTVADEEVAFTGVLPLGTLPDRSDVDAYHLLADGDQLYSLDTTTDLGGLTVTPADVVRFDGTTDTIEFDASVEGIPAGVDVDAVTTHASGDLLLSFDTTVDLGGGVVAHDEDLVRFLGSSTYSIEFDGSSESVAAGLDLDGAGVLPSSTNLYLSFDGSGSLGGVSFDDEDVLEFDASGPTWSLFYDGSAAHAALAASDVDAVPEPGVGLQLLAGAVALGWASRRRRA